MKGEKNDQKQHRKPSQEHRQQSLALGGISIIFSNNETASEAQLMTFSLLVAQLARGEWEEALVIPSPPRSEEALEPSRVVNSTCPISPPAHCHLGEFTGEGMLHQSWKLWFSQVQCCWRAEGEREPFHLLCLIPGGRKLSPSPCLLGHYAGEPDHSQPTTWVPDPRHCHVDGIWANFAFQV